MKAPFPIQPELTAIAMAYRNTELIADSVLPITTVGKQEFKYIVYDKADRYTIPDTKVGRKSRPNEVEFGATEKTESTEDHALDDPVPQADIENAPPNFDPLGNATEGIMDLIQLRREKAVADLVFDANNYATANKETLAGTDQWSDGANSDPIADITDAIESMIMRPNRLVVGSQVMIQLARHPKVLKAIHKSSGDTGVARRSDLEELFELEILVGKAHHNSAAEGQTAVYSRVWGKQAALLRIDPNANTRRGVTFGYTARWGTPVAGSERDSNIGMRGGQRVRAGESVKPLITAADVGYLFIDAVA